LRGSILALNSARQTALEELETLSLSHSEVSDYKDFVVYLNTRIANYCMELAEQGDPSALAQLPCPAAPTMMRGKDGPIPSENEFIYTTGTEVPQSKTRAEQTADLDDALMAALGDFDEMLLKEEEKASARVPSQRETVESGTTASAGSAGSEGGAEESGSGADGENADATAGETASKAWSEEPAGASASAKSGAGGGRSATDHSQYGAPGGKLPPPEDDDIVARQLREAAEKETDPVLKKKLWEEYWKYKGVKKRS
jgi:hypothetical protein